MTETSMVFLKRDARKVNNFCVHMGNMRDELEKGAFQQPEFIDTLFLIESHCGTTNNKE